MVDLTGVDYLYRMLAYLVEYLCAYEWDGEITIDAYTEWLDNKEDYPRFAVMLDASIQHGGLPWLMCATVFLDLRDRGTYNADLIAQARAEVITDHWIALMRGEEHSLLDVIKGDDLMLTPPGEDDPPVVFDEDDDGGAKWVGAL